MTTARLIPAHLIPPHHLPLPELHKRLKHHSYPRALQDPTNANHARPLSAPPAADPHAILSSERNRFSCSCGANPLNDPHNLAVLAGLYRPNPLTALTDRRYEHLHPHPQRFYNHNLQAFYLDLFTLLPIQIQALLTTPYEIDNLRNVTITDPDSPLLPIITRPNLWPYNYHAPQEYLSKPIPHTYQADTYQRDEWLDWNKIHRQDVIAHNPAPYIMARDERKIPYADLPRPSDPLPHFHPELPLAHPPVPMRFPLEKYSKCWCGVLTNRRVPPSQYYRWHLYEAFVGRTVARAYEIPTQAWQESTIGVHAMRSNRVPADSLPPLVDAFYEFISSPETQ